MRREKIELTDGFGVEVIVCGNTETLADGREGIDEEAASEAVRAASNAICDSLGQLPSIESAFSEWHGGRCYGQRPDLPGRFVVANIYQRDEDGDWDWAGWSKISANMQAEIKSAVEAAEAALVASLDESERLENRIDIDTLLCSTDSKTGDPSIFANWDEAQKMYDELGWEGDPSEDGIMSIADYADQQRRLGGFSDPESFADHVLKFASGEIELDRDELVAALESHFTE